jgi:cytochrome c biogenesis protein CcdA/thiol-disulfide isomerase/thioredoxin
VIVLLLVGFLGGLVTGISPCILPVLPVIFAAGAASGLDDGRSPDAQTRAPVLMAAGGDSAASGVDPVGAGTAGSPASADEAVIRQDESRRRRRPFAVVAGLVVSFSAVTLFGTWVLSALGLPLDLLRWLGLVVLAVVGLGLVVPAVGDLLERPFARLTAGAPATEGGGIVLGLSLGLVFVPCAGPVLAAITVVGATHHLGFSAILLTVAFSLGVAIPLLVFALLGQRLASHMQVVRTHAAQARRIIGAVLLLTALILALNLTNGLQQAVPGYTNALQTHLESNTSAKRALAGVTGQATGGALADCMPESPLLQRCGSAPAFLGITRWLNTPAGQPLSIRGLRGRVVLVDFWTYSCINCQRSLPYVESWNAAYAKDGLTVVGVHTPEFAFEHVISNITQAAAQLGVHYPIAVDNDYATWNNYQNSYWPAEYLIDATGQVRHVDFGEGQYSQTETFIRQLLTAADPRVVLPARADLPDLTPQQQTTPESYLGYQHGAPNLAGQGIVPDQITDYATLTSIPQDEYAYGGQWDVGSEQSTAGASATLGLHFQAADVYLVLGGSGTIQVSLEGRPSRSVVVSGEPKLYQLVGPGSYQDATLTLVVSPGIKAYDFTFG